MGLKVSFDKNSWDRKVRTLTRHGFTAELIARQTGLSIGQVLYRRGQLPIQERPNAYRRGESPQAQILIDRIDKALGTCKSMQREIRQLLKGR